MKFRFGLKKESGKIAKERLKFLLVSDRLNCSPKMLELMREDIIRAISQYMNIDVEHTEVRIKPPKRGSAKSPSLSAYIPILDWKETIQQ